MGTTPLALPGQELETQVTLLHFHSVTGADACGPAFKNSVGKLYISHTQLTCNLHAFVCFVQV